MDNRRFSVRAEAGAPVPERRGVTYVPLLDRAVELTRLNWEILAYAALIIIALLTRLWDLGPRALHHDESIHAYFSHYYLRSGDYTTTPGAVGGYDPTYHGPFLYHITALMFFLFGTTDAVARLAPAIFGVILVGMTWLLRPFIGRVGAVLAALLIVLSPSISYYSRSLRHDIFALAGVMLLFIGLLWFMRTHQPKWVYLGAAGLAIAYASHELTFIIMFLFVAFLAIAYFLFPRFAEATYGRYQREGDDVNPIASAAASLWTQRWTLLGAVLLFLGIYVVLFTNLLTKPGLVFSGITEGLTYWLGEHGEARGNQPLFYYGLLLMPFYEPLALFAGIGTVIYMIVKWVRREGDEVRPGDDVDTGDYEPTDEYGHPLPLIDGLRGLTLAFLAFWSFGALVAFSIAGEKMPWLNMQIALPFTLLAAAGLGRLLTGMEWRQVWRGGGLIFGVTIVLLLFAFFAFMAHLNGTMPAPQGTPDSIGVQSMLRGLILFLFTVGLLALAGWLAYKMLPGRAIKVLALTFVVLLAAYGLRSMMLVNFRHGDVPAEMLVYTQTSPSVPIVAGMIERLSRDETAFDQRGTEDITGGRSLEIFIDENESIHWPFHWYFRDMKKLRSFDFYQKDQQGNYVVDQNGNKVVKTETANIIAPNAPVILVSESTENLSEFQSLIRDKYTTQRHVLNWWFPEETYKQNNVGDLGLAFDWLGRNWQRYMLYRDPGMPLGSRNYYLHVRNDLAAKVGLSEPQGGTVITRPGEVTNPQGPIYGLFDLANAGAERGQFNLPRDIAVASDGSIYVVDTANMRIQKFDSTGEWQAIIGHKGNGDGQFNPFSDEAAGTGPGGIAVDAQGNIYVADTWNHRIQKFDKDGKFLTKWGEFINLSDAAAANDGARDSKFFGPRGIAVGPDGNVYVTDTGNKRVLIFDANGRFLRKIDSGMSPTKVAPNYPFTAPGEMNEPIGIAVDSAGNVYVADTNNSRIQKFDSEGKFVTQWRVDPPNWDATAYLEPFLAVDAEGNVYATAPNGKRVIKYSPDGQKLAEKAEAGAISLKTPTGIAVAPDGTVYVVDTSAHGVVNMGKIEQP